ncbi:MAG TPA: extracellular solute-binding protein [Beijerinckiaceae bacterium]|jgi:ABC-type Fe3+ transport system substrate-binding protein
MPTRRAWLGALALTAALSIPAFGQTPQGKVTVVTSFSRDVTDPMKRAFERAVPGAVLEVQNRNTNAGVKLLQETRAANQADLFWASAPDAFEVLKGAGLLEAYKPQAQGVPEKIGQFPINDPQGFYFGFAVSGYGVMWNERYVKANRLPEPAEWTDLAKAPYYDHVAITAPSRSGTTHLTVEAILQNAGWNEGWAIVKGFSGNLRTIAERSFGVPDAVNSGQVGYGVVIDFFAYSAQGAGFPVKFVYPTMNAIVPASVAVVKNAPNAAGARAFVEFLLSPQGQEILFEPTIRRLPVLPSVYARAPAGLPNPFKLGAAREDRPPFDVDLSERRYAAVDVLFDQLVSFQLDALKRVTKTLHDVEARLARKDDPKARALIAEARALVAAMPVTAEQAASEEIAAAFKGGGGAGKGPRQAELEQQWAAFAKENYAQAQAKADEALRLVN